MKTLIILAGGASSRMKRSEATASLSEAEIAAANVSAKCLIVLEGDDRPVLDYLIKNAAMAGIQRILLITSTTNKDFKKWYGDQSWNLKNLSVRVEFAVQYIPEGRIKPNGTADALLQALEQYPELKNQLFLASNSDNLYSAKAIGLLLKTDAANAFIAYDRSGLIFPEEKIARFALCKLDATDNLIDIVEKPDLTVLEKYRDNSGVLRVSMNIFKFSGSEFYPFLKNCPQHPVRKEKELPTAIMNMINATGTMLGIPLKEHVPDLTTKADIALFRNEVNKQS